MIEGVVNKTTPYFIDKVVSIMAVWKCTVCGETKEGRCRPQKCPKCGATKESFEKQA